MTTDKICRFYEILKCGAKNSTIARALNEEGYAIVTFGWEYYDRKGNHYGRDGECYGRCVDAGVTVCLDRDNVRLDAFEYLNDFPAATIEIMKILAEVEEGYPNFR